MNNFDVSKVLWTTQEVSGALDDFRKMGSVKRAGLAERLQIAAAPNLPGVPFAALPERLQMTLLFKAVYREAPWGIAATNYARGILSGSEKYSSRDKVRKHLYALADQSHFKGRSVVPLLLCLWDGVHEVLGATSLRTAAKNYRAFATHLCHVPRTAEFIRAAVENRQGKLALDEPTASKKEATATPVAELAALESAVTSSVTTPVTDKPIGARYYHYLRRLSRHEYATTQAAERSITASNTLSPIERQKLLEEDVPRFYRLPVHTPDPKPSPLQDKKKELETRVVDDAVLRRDVARRFENTLRIAFAADVTILELADMYAEAIAAYDAAWGGKK